MVTAADKNTIKCQKVPITSDQLEFLLQMQLEIMEKIAVSQGHQQILDDLCQTAEAMLPNAVASIMLFAPSGDCLQVRAAPNISKDGIMALNGLVPGERAGSCGTAVYNNKPQFVYDTMSDPRWSASAFQQFAQKFGINACWSMPIRSKNNKAIGSFALSSMEKRQPHAFHKKLLEICAHIAGIVLQREATEQELWNLAHHDPLTELANRNLFNIRLDHAIEKAKRTQGIIAILYIDLDNFKDINDTLGHEAGDKALKEVSFRIAANIREEDTLSRVGGDEFTLMIESHRDTLKLNCITEKVQKSLAQPIVLGQNQFYITASIGISLYPDDGLTAGNLLQNADIAMYEAKRQGRGRCVYYENELTESLIKRLELKSEIKHGIEEREFVLHYQPQFSCKSNKLVGAEVLVRWQHPTKGLIPPLEFIPIAEDAGLIVELGCMVAYTASHQCVSWWAEGLPEFTLSINLSANEIEPYCSNKITEILEETKIPIERLEMEVTESLIMSRKEIAFNELTKMKDQGLSIAMDDFGTGHSSLSQLKNLPLTKLKIDKSFVSDLPKNQNDAAIVRTIIAMAKTLGLRVVAEGVETQAQKDFLIREGCDGMQGFFLGKPVDADVFRTKLESFKSGSNFGVKANRC